MPDLFKGHGYEVNGQALYVGNLPGRRQVCLYVQDGSVLRVLAFFKTAERAREALDMIDRIAATPLRA